MKQVTSLAIVIMSVTVMACGDAGNKSNEHNHATASKDSSSVTNSTLASEQVKLNDDNLNAVYQHYIHLTTALVNEDSAEAKIASNAIHAGSSNINGAEKLASSAARITAAKTIENQRNEYAHLSNEMIALVKKSGVISGELFVDFCPMALDDKGAHWLSSRKEIRNPYFGDKMLTCGEVQETIRK
jgi:hypothetical protein